MNVGEKIRSLRLSKLMTQAELAGGQITRNMLSAIEHGSALPSLSTALYLAERLGVPVGYLLSEESEEFSYRRMANIANIRRAFAEGDFAGCLSLLHSVFGESTDDELALIAAECECGVAEQHLTQGRLRMAVAAMDRALAATAQTVYDTAWLRRRVALRFRYLAGISPTLVSDVLDAEEVEAAVYLGDEFSEYMMAVEKMQCCRESGIEPQLPRLASPLYQARLQALCLMHKGEYLAAQEALEALLARDDLTFGILLFEVFGDLEFCYRKNDDYKRAYEFSASRLGLLERLLEEV